MLQSSKVTNVLLAIIAACLLIIAFRPMSVVPPAAAQALPGAAETDTDRFTAITAPSKSAQMQADATRMVAASIDGLAKSTEKIAQAVDNLSRAVTDMAAKSAEGAAAAGPAPGGVITTVTPAK